MPYSIHQYNAYIKYENDCKDMPKQTMKCLGKRQGLFDFIYKLLERVFRSESDKFADVFESYWRAFCSVGAKRTPVQSTVKNAGWTLRKYVYFFVQSAGSIRLDAVSVNFKYNLVELPEWFMND